MKPTLKVLDEIYIPEIVKETYLAGFQCPHCLEGIGVQVEKGTKIGTIEFDCPTCENDLQPWMCKRLTNVSGRWRLIKENE